MGSGAAMAFIKAKKTAWNTERGMALLYEDDPKNGVIIPIDALPPLGAHARTGAGDKGDARPTIGAQRNFRSSPRIGCGPQDRRRKSRPFRRNRRERRWRERGGLAEVASTVFSPKPCRSSSPRHRRRSWRRIGILEDRRSGVTAGVEACTPTRSAPCGAQEQGRSARLCASLTATSAARHEPVPIIEA